MNASKSRIVTASVILFAAFNLSMAQSSGLTSRPSAAKPSDLIFDEDKYSVVRLQSIDVQVEVAGNVASTRHTWVVKNKSARVVEGELTFSLPAGSSVTHFALDIDGKMRDAVPVEKAWGTRVFNSIVGRRVDPGLLERVGADKYRMRIFPFPAHGVRTVTFAYDEALARDGDSLRYRLSIGCPDSLENFSVKATVLKRGGAAPVAPDSVDGLRFNKVGGNYVASFARENCRPPKLSFALPAPAPAAAPLVMMRPTQGGYRFLASVAPPCAVTRKKQWGDELAIIWDVSRSSYQRKIERELEALGIIFAEKKNVNVHLYYLNNTLTKMVTKKTVNGEHRVIDGNWDGLRNILKKAVFDGGTDFSKIRLKAIAGNEILFFSDGVSTLGDVDFIKNDSANLKRPIHCVVSSAQADYKAMKSIADKTSGKYVNINGLSSERLKDELLNEHLLFLGMEYGAAVREAYPSVATRVRGDFSPAGVSGASKAEVTMLFGFGKKVENRVTVTLNAKNADTLSKIDMLWARKKSDELDTIYEKNSAELTNVGRKFGIVTRNTSLIVLEAVEDYVRYNITPPATETALYEEYRRRMKGREGTSGGVPHNNTHTKSMAFEEAEVIGYLDNPTPTYIVDIDDPDADPVTLDRSFKENIIEIGLDILGPNMPAKYPKTFLMPQRNCADDKKYYLLDLTGKTAEAYQRYLKMRNTWGGIGFYLDFADWFYKRGDRKTALRVITGIADWDGKYAEQYRALGYRLKEYGEYAQEAFICRFATTIIWQHIGPDPQTQRDYALALDDNGDAQSALDLLYALLTKTYSEKSFFGGNWIKEVVSMDINRLIAENANLDTSKIDGNSITGEPVDIRVVISKNVRNVGINIRVLGPNGEVYGNDNGEAKVDYERAAAPTQFFLRNAAKGEYRVLIDYRYHYDGRYFRLGYNSEPATVMAEIYTKHAGKAEQRRIVTLQLYDKDCGETLRTAELTTIDY